MNPPGCVRHRRGHQVWVFYGSGGKQNKPKKFWGGFVLRGYLINREVALYPLQWNYSTKGCREGAAIAPVLRPARNTAPARDHLSASLMATSICQRDFRGSSLGSVR